MLEYDSIVIEDNENKVVWCRLKEDEGKELHRMRIYDTCEKDTPDMILYHFDIDSDKEYRKEDVLSIEDFCEDQDVENELNGNDERIINHAELRKFKHSDDVYKFSNKQELTEIYKHLGEPMLANTPMNEDKFLNDLDDNVYGIVYYWMEYDDWSCGHPYSYFMKIIFNVKGDLCETI